MDDILTLSLLVGLELILGIDNVLVISILVSRLPKEQQNWARNLGLLVALGARLLMLMGAAAITQMRDPVLLGFSYRDLLLLGGAVFLIYKAVTEIHHTVEHKGHHEEKKAKSTLSSIILQIVLLDIVFSLDSVITAIGMTDHLWVIFTSVVVSFAIVLCFAKKIGEFIMGSPGLKILALSFLVTIGVTLFMEGMHKDVPKAYIYLPMGFALLIEILQMRYDKNQRKNLQLKSKK